MGWFEGTGVGILEGTGVGIFEGLGIGGTVVGESVSSKHSSGIIDSDIHSSFQSPPLQVATIN